MDELLACRPILHTQSVEEARAFLGQRGVGLELLGAERDRAGFEVRYNGVYLPRLWLGYLRYGAAIAARIAPVRGDYWVHVPMHGRLTVTTASRALDFDPLHAAVTSPFEPHSLVTDAGSARLSLAVKADALARHLAALLEESPRAPLRFTPVIGLESGFGQSFARLLQSVARDYCLSATLSHPLVINDFEQFVMTSLLISVPHNYSDALRKRDKRVAPRDVRRVADYLREHAAEPIALEDLVRLSGVAARTLLKHFKDTYGISPMRFLRNLRMQRARDDLLREPSTPVSEVALRWGFSHLGRFAQAYRARFGEPPSQTRRAH
jgi:AraC-like DNA-binding protein